MAGLTQRGRKNSVTGNKKGSDDGIVSRVNDERACIPKVRTGGARGHQCLAVSVGQAHLLRFLPCHSKTHWCGGDLTKPAIYILAFPFTQSQYLLETLGILHTSIRSK